MGKIKLFILDDHQMLIDGIKALLKNEPAYAIIGEASSGIVALDTIKKNQPDIILSDISMPEMSGVELTRELKKLYPNYYLLDYYCFENYLFHPENIASLKLDGFSKADYIKDIKAQKDFNKSKIISNYKKAIDSYQEFRIE